MGLFGKAAVGVVTAMVGVGAVMNASEPALAEKADAPAAIP